MGELFSNVLSIIAALLLLGIFVTVHELGHYSVARLLGVRVLEFAVGMGPVVWGKEHNGIRYNLRAFPVGGLCRFCGDEDGPPEDHFNAQKVYKRILVVLAGPVMNILFALLVGIGVLAGYGRYTDETQVRIASLNGPETPAAIAGVLPGDILREVEDVPVTDNDNAIAAILAAPADRMTITVERDGETLEFVLEEVYDAQAAKNLIGVSVQAEWVRERLSFLQAIGGSFEYVWSLIMQMVAFLGSLFTQGVQQGELVGPVGTVSVIGSAVKLGFEMVLQLAVLISVNLAFLNLLPLPALDGGRLVFLVIEAIRGKAIAPEREGMVHFVGMMLLLGLVVLLTFSDIRLLLGG